jgi:hypothetical protein
MKALVSLVIAILVTVSTVRPTPAQTAGIPTLSFTQDEYAVREDEGSVVCVLRRPSPLDAPLTAAYHIEASDTASGGSHDDVAPLDGVVTFRPGYAYAYMNVGVIADRLFEPTEGLTIEVWAASPPYNVPTKHDTAHITIRDDDTIGVFLDGDKLVDEGERVTMRVQRTGSLVQPLSVLYWKQSEADWPCDSVLGAASPCDFDMTNGYLHIGAGQSGASFSIETFEDDVTEPSEKFTVFVLVIDSNSIGSGPKASADVTIEDCPKPPPILVDCPKIVPEDCGTMTVTISRTPNETSIVYGTYKTICGTATDLEVQVLSGYYALTDASPTHSFTVLLPGDAYQASYTSEGNESFDIEVTYQGSTGSGTVEIPVVLTDNESSCEYAFDRPFYKAYESDGEVRLNVIRRLDGDCVGDGGVDTVNVEVIPNSAEIGSDISGPTIEPLVFHSGKTFATIKIPLTQDFHNGDTPGEPVEYFAVRLSFEDPGRLGTQRTAVVAIHDADDDDDEFAFSSECYFATEENGLVSVTVTRPDATAEQSVDLELHDAEAVATQDFAPLGSTHLMFAPGVDSVTAYVAIASDHANEGTEYFTMCLTSGGQELQSAAVVISDLSIPEGIAFSSPMYIFPERETNCPDSLAKVELPILRWDDTTGSFEGSKYVVSPGSAVAGVDYLITDWVFPAQSGATAGAFDLTLIADAAGSEEDGHKYVPIDVYYFSRGDGTWRCTSCVVLIMDNEAWWYVGL